MSINLNEFTREQLEFAIEVFKEQALTHGRKIIIAESFDESPLKNKILKEQNYNLDTSLLFRIQLENALDEVKSKERELSN